MENPEEPSIPLSYSDSGNSSEVNQAPLDSLREQIVSLKALLLVEENRSNELQEFRTEGLEETRAKGFEHDFEVTQDELELLREQIVSLKALLLVEENRSNELESELQFTYQEVAVYNEEIAAYEQGWGSSTYSFLKQNPTWLRMYYRWLGLDLD